MTNMYILFGECDLKPAEFRTFLIIFHEIYKSGGQSVKIEDLTKKGISKCTIMRHIDKCEKNGLLVKQKNYTRTLTGDIKSLPNTYSYLDVKYKVWIDDDTSITEDLAYSIQTKLGKEFSDYIKKKYKLIDINIEEVTNEDKVNYRGIRVYESIEMFGLKTKIIMNQ